MDITYLLSILDLYLLKENNDSLVIEINKDNNIIKIELSYLSSYLNKTYVKVNESVFLDNIKYILTKIQNNLNINKEEYNNNYKIIFDNNRQLIFNNFDIKELELIRNNLNNLNNDFNFNIIDNKDISYDQIYEENKNIKPKLSFGFSSFITVFLMSIWFLDIFMIALWIFKSLK